MGELLLKVGDGSGLEDGDVIAAFTRKQIRIVHAAELCKPIEADRNDSGLLLKDSLCFQFHELVSRYRFSRISSSVVKRDDLQEGTAQVFNDRTDDNGERINVRAFVHRRRRNPACMMFGEDGGEIWFSGSRDIEQESFRRLWAKIGERHDIERDEGFNHLWPFGRLDIRSHLAVRVEDLTPAQARSLVEPLLEVDESGRFRWEAINRDGTTTEATGTEDEWTPPDDSGNWSLKIRKKRRRQVKWRHILADLRETREAVEDATRPVGEELDRRGRRCYTSKEQPPQSRGQVKKKRQQR